MLADSLLIRKKLTILLFISSCSVLLVATIGFAVSDWINSRNVLVNHLQSQASVVGNNSVSALLFNDRESATGTLSSLREEVNIVAAYLYDGDKAEFASFKRLDHLPSASWPTDRSGLVDGFLYTKHEIHWENEQLGYVVLYSEMESWQQQQLERVMALAWLFLGALIVAIFIANTAQSVITTPILKLADTVRNITRTRDYQLRADKVSHDEIGTLADDFNEMLHQIQSRDSELQQARDHLEDKVRERTDELYELTKKLEHQAFHDPLTGLANRAMLDESLQGAINFAQRQGQQLSLFFLDLDRFKGINDSLGHDVGDKLLINLGRKLKQNLRSSDTLVRLGGDEFAVLLQDTTPREAADVAQKLIEAISEPVDVDGYNLQVTTSIGISVYPEDGNTASAILKNADTAMYSSKEAGRNQFSFYAREMNERTERRMRLENKLRTAVRHSHFEVYYQPKWDCRSLKPIGLEALIRWNDAEEGFISPAEFIPLAEDCGLIGMIDQWVMKTACNELLELYDGKPELLLSVNYSAAHFLRKDVSQQVTEMLAETGYPADKLELEITETVIASEMEGIYEQLGEIRELGVEISIDDFGVAYSSLSRLKQLPLNTLKIDRSFIQDIGQDDDDEVIVRTIIDMAHNLNLKVVAEGVETEHQYQFVNRYGCDAVQGFLFGKPHPLTELRDVLSKGDIA
ncbi:EAL domain-containing protein [Neptuniibacter sp.]|uniref:putative bifunctional diguanylate cyclase/phosphodiesterase n=1 Tax=Neptuniibacter sp. TaxID=1962643 RepID=UPI0026388811|nr:EAL domain-containing protein [Neptuniibacter sp.]MCP4598038.1 EAL domain-containing protein [Neptuniibacter sp.]